MKTTALHTRLALLTAAIATSAHASPIITSVVESGGDAGAISARYTGQTFANTGGLGTITVGVFGEDVPAFTDRSYEWNSVLNSSSVAIGLPSYLVGGEYVVAGNDRRDNNSYSLTITIAQPSFVYLLIDNRGSTTDGNASTPPDLGTGVNALGLPFMQWVLDSGFAPISTGKNRTGNASLPDEVGVDITAPNLGVGPGVSIDDFHSVYGKSVPAGSFAVGEYAAAFNTGRNIYAVVVTPVPEPSSVALLIFGAVALMRRGTQRGLRAPARMAGRPAAVSEQQQ